MKNFFYLEKLILIFTMKRKISILLISLLCLNLYSKDNKEINKVFLVFKTHLDVGFTDLSSKVTERYINDFIPKALTISEQLAAEGAQERYVWTTGSWLVWKFLQTAPSSEVKRLEAAIERGDIVWNAVPYTVESE